MTNRIETIYLTAIGNIALDLLADTDYKEKTFCDKCEKTWRIK